MPLPSRQTCLRVLLWSALPVALLAGWAWAASASVVVPSIGETVGVLWRMNQSPQTLDAAPLLDGILVSVIRVTLGFALAVVTAVPIGLAVGRWRPARDLLAPLIAGGNVISPIAWIPVAIIVFGFASPATLLAGDEHWKMGILDQLRFAIIAVIWYGGFFPIVVNTADGVAGVRRSHLEAVRVLGASRRQVLRRVVLPSAAPQILTGLRMGAAIAWRVIIAAEIFPGTRSGLGYTIAVAGQMYEYEYVFASILVIATIGMSLDGLLRLAHRRVGHWQEAQR
jgi:NitT/TauT family transport system permease protein